MAYFERQRHTQHESSEGNGQQGAGWSEERSGPMWVLEQHNDKHKVRKLPNPSRQTTKSETDIHRQIQNTHTYTQRDKEILAKRWLKGQVEGTAAFTTTSNRPGTWQADLSRSHFSFRSCAQFKEAKQFGVGVLSILSLIYSTVL